MIRDWWQKLLYAEGEEIAYEHSIDRFLAWIFPTGVLFVLGVAFYLSIGVSLVWIIWMSVT